MAEFRVSLEDLLVQCRTAAEMTIAQRMLFFESGESGWIHYVPRLLVMLEGEREIQYWENGHEVRRIVEAPAFLFCAKSGGLLPGKERNHCSQTLSFSYYPTYIRAMLIDYDGVNPPPTSRDIYYHTTKPLSPPGTRILELLDTLHDAHEDEIAGKMLPILFELTLHALEFSSAAPVRKVRKLWDDINTFLREHRNEMVTREDVARLFRVSPVYVSELCKKYADDSFSHLKLQYQLEHARNLLLHTRLSLEEIAEQSGFSSANYFIRRFKIAFGTTPHVYRNHPQS